MRAEARCQHCGREFLLFQLYNAGPAVADRCPHCSRHLGLVNARGLAARIDRAAQELVTALGDLAGHKPDFRLKADSILGPITEAVVAAGGGGPAGRGPQDQVGNVKFWRWPRRRPRRSAA